MLGLSTRFYYLDFSLRDILSVKEIAHTVAVHKQIYSQDITGGIKDETIEKLIKL